MVIMARRLVFRHCEVRNEEASSGNSLEEKDPGMTSMSNGGAFAKEFYVGVSLIARCIAETNRG